MNIPRLRDRIPNHDRPSRRRAIIGAGLLVLVASLVGVWYSLPRPEVAGTPDELQPAGGTRTFALTPHATPRPIANVAFEDGTGRKLSLADFKGKVVLLNVWATWCAPCRKEMPTLDRLQSRLGGKDFEVVALSLDRDGPAIVRRFFDEIDVHGLGIYVDTSTESMSKLEIIGVPTTLLIDRKGREVARYTGVAEWDRPEVTNTIERYLRNPN